MKIKFDGFILALAVAVAAAMLFPGFGARDGVLHPQFTNKLGVALIFLLHGIGLSFQSLKAGTLHWRLHLAVQACTFVLFPLLGMLLYFTGQRWLGADLSLGFYFLCALPSTVSSSVAITAAARGNIPAALFNATLSSLLGVVLTPLWIGVVTAGDSEGPGFLKVVGDLCLWLVLPLVVGQLLRPMLAGWASRNKSRIHIADRGSILFLVYTSFCDSMQEGVWSAHGPGTIVLVVLVCAALFGGVMLVSGALGRAFGFPVEDRIALVFCGSKKSMASGIPMAQLIFAQQASLGLLVLPLLVYHTLQLVWAGALAARWSRRPG